MGLNGNVGAVRDAAAGHGPGAGVTGGGLNWHVMKCACVGALGGLLFGFDMAVIAGTTTGLTRAFGLSPRGLGFTVSVALFGTVLGAVCAGVLESRYGARAVLRVLAVFYVVSALGCAFAPGWVLLLAARFLGGTAIGGSSVLGPVYIAELAPARLRGRLVGLFQIAIVLGALAAYISNYLMAHTALGAREWRADFGVAAIPAVIFFVVLFTIPQSARWLAAKGRVTEAESVLRLVGAADPRGELREITQAIEADARNSREGLFQWKYRKPICLAIALAMFNQLSGINVVSYYVNDIFAAAGFNRFSAGMQAIFVGGMELVATFIAMSLVDKLGRKPLLLIGSVGLAAMLTGVAAIFAMGTHANWLLPLLCVYMCSFAVSQGAVIWAYLSEIFPTRVRGKGQSLGCTTHWVMNGLISGSYPVVARYSKVMPFGFFAVMMVVQFFAVWFFFPETKNVSLEQLQRELVPEDVFDDSAGSKARA
jgi:sugar porter (SP) family MFS transporter